MKKTMTHKQDNLENSEIVWRRSNTMKMSMTQHTTFSKAKSSCDESNSPTDKISRETKLNGTIMDNANKFKEDRKHIRPFNFNKGFLGIK